jgi:hypothetical protein
VEQRSPAVCNDSNKKEGKGDMTKTPISLQDLRRSLYIKAKTEPVWRFWGLYVHVCKMETLRKAYLMAKKNDGAPGIDGVTFEAIEESGVESFLQQIRYELVSNTYQPMRARKKEIPKDGGTKVRVLSIPSIRDRVVQGALKLILEPIFEADFQPGSYGYRPKRTAHEAVYRVAQAIDQSKTSVIDLDLRAYFDNVQHSLLLEKVARRVQDDDVMRLLKMILKATGKKGVPQGGVVTPLTQKVISNLSGWSQAGGEALQYLTCVLRGNMFMTYGSVDQSGQGPAVERRSRPARAPYRVARRGTAFIPRVRPVRASSIPVPGASLPARPAGRSHGGYGADHAQASAEHSTSVAEVCEKQRPDYRSNRDTRVERVSRCSKKAWLSRAQEAARFKSTSTMRLIACASRSSPRPTIFWCPVGSARSVAE